MPDIGSARRQNLQRASKLFLIFGAARGIEVIDLGQWLQGVDVRRIALDGCHFNAEGHQLIGKRFAEYLLERDLKVQN